MSRQQEPRESLELININASLLVVRSLLSAGLGRRMDKVQPRVGTFIKFRRAPRTQLRSTIHGHFAIQSSRCLNQLFQALPGGCTTCPCVDCTVFGTLAPRRLLTATFDDEE